MSKVNKRELSEILGVSERTLSTYQQDGLPIEIESANGLPNTYNTVTVIDWLLRNDVRPKRLPT